MSRPRCMQDAVNETQDDQRQRRVKATLRLEVFDGADDLTVGLLLFFEDPAPNAIEPPGLTIGLGGSRAATIR